jgi:chitinase
MIYKLLTSTLIFALLISLTMAENVVVGYFPNCKFLSRPFFFVTISNIIVLSGLYDKFPVSKIDFKTYTHIHYAFAIMISGNVPQWTDPNSIDTQLTQLVDAAHASSSKVLISVGGWSGSITFRYVHYTILKL